MIASELVITPEPRRLRWMHDVFGNCVAIASFAAPLPRASPSTRGSCSITRPQNTPDFSIEDDARHYPFTYGSDEMPDLVRLIERHVPRPRPTCSTHWVRRFVHHGRETDTAKMLMTLTYAIKESFTYGRRHERGTQDPLTTLGDRQGHVPRLRRADDGGGALARPSRRASCRAICMCPAGRRRSIAAAATRMRGARCTCPARAGWNSIPPTASSATATSSAWPWPAIRARALPLHGTYFGDAAAFTRMEVSVDVREIASLAITADGLFAPGPVAAPAPPRRMSAAREPADTSAPATIRTFAFDGSSLPRRARRGRRGGRRR